MIALTKRRLHRSWSVLLSGGLVILLSACPDPGGGGHDPSGVGNDLSGLWQDLPTPCTSDEQCASDAKGPCQVAHCELPAGVCQVTSRPDGSPCTTGNACIIGESCSHGICSGGIEKPPCQTVKCGIDECGNTCPGCPAGQECENGHCKPVSCGDIGWMGCCTGDGRLHYCDEAEVIQIVCPANAHPQYQACGWDPQSQLFDCVDQDTPPPDPQISYLCPGEICPGELCFGVSCGYDCGQLCGLCAEGSWCTPAGACELCTCEGKSCGDDGCGNSCGDCDVGLACIDGSCQDPCEGLTYTGCCKGLDTVAWCEHDMAIELDCEGQGCGWDPTHKLYGCGFVGEDPSGHFPIDCQAPPPDVGPEPGPEATEAVAAEPTVEPAVEAVELVPDVPDVPPDAPDLAEPSPDVPDLTPDLPSFTPDAPEPSPDVPDVSPALPDSVAEPAE